MHTSSVSAGQEKKPTKPTQMQFSEPAQYSRESAGEIAFGFILA